MEALLFLAFFAVYLVISVLLISATVRWARKRQRSLWRWGLLATFVMYNLVFWDWIPSLVLQNNYCKTEAGFWLYKMPAQWSAENPDEIARPENTLPFTITGDSDAFYTFHLNRRIDWVNRKKLLWPSIRRYEETLVDTKTNEVLARQIYFQSGSCGGGGMGLGSYRFWMQRCECVDNERRNKGEFSDISEKFKLIIRKTP